MATIIVVLDTNIVSNFQHIPHRESRSNSQDLGVVHISSQDPFQHIPHRESRSNSQDLGVVHISSQDPFQHIPHRESRSNSARQNPYSIEP